MVETLVRETEQTTEESITMLYGEDRAAFENCLQVLQQYESRLIQPGRHKNVTELRSLKKDGWLTISVLAVPFRWEGNEWQTAFFPGGIEGLEAIYQSVKRPGSDLQKKLR